MRSFLAGRGSTKNDRPLDVGTTHLCQGSEFRNVRNADDPCATCRLGRLPSNACTIETDGRLDMCLFKYQVFLLFSNIYILENLFSISKEMSCHQLSVALRGYLPA